MEKETNSAFLIRFHLSGTVLHFTSLHGGHTPLYNKVLSFGRLRPDAWLRSQGYVVSNMTKATSDQLGLSQVIWYSNQSVYLFSH